jgi:hypothetical protein
MSARQCCSSKLKSRSLSNAIVAGTASALRFEVSQTVPNAGALWAFVSVTNEDTQELFVIVPQHR